MTSVSAMKRGRPASADLVSPRMNPMAHVGYMGSRHLLPGRIPSARPQRAVMLRVIDLNVQTLVGIKQVSSGLKRLDLSHLNLDKIRDELLSGLVALERLDVSHNRLAEGGFPSEIRNLSGLLELNAHHNSLSSLPKVLRRLRTLTRLKLSNNKLQVADGVEKLRRLQVLVLDHNDLESIPAEMWTSLRRLQSLHLAHNHIHVIPGSVRCLRHLTQLDISHNQLTVLPTEVLLLPQVENIDASCNAITRIPSVTLNGNVSRRLTSLDLSENALVKFPEQLLHLVERLDLTYNKIKIIPSSVVKRLDWNIDQRLEIGNNPLVSPPAEICECGLRSIVQYFQEAKSEMKIYQGLKLLVLGASGAGKSSLVQTMVDQQSRLVTDDEITQGIDLYDLSLDMEEGNPMGKSLNLSIWDFSGNPHYLFSHYFFLQQPCLIMVVFNMATYDDSQFHSVIGCWLDWVIAQTNQVILLPVGTHADKISKRRAKEVCKEVKTKLDAYHESHLADIKKEIKKIESRPQISPALSEQLKGYIGLLSLKYNVKDTVVPVSCLSLEGVTDMIGSIKDLASEFRLFPSVGRPIPTFWGDVEAYVEERGYAMSSPIMKWEAYENEIVNKFGMRHLLKKITLYLHETGKVLWFSQHATLRDYVIMRPSWLTRVFTSLLCPQGQEKDPNVEDNLRACMLTTQRLEALRADCHEKGLVDRELLRYMWCQLVNPELNSPLLELLLLLLDHFEIGYVVPLPVAKPTLFSVASSRASERNHKEPDKISLSLVPSSNASSSSGSTAAKGRKIRLRRQDSMATIASEKTLTTEVAGGKGEAPKQEEPRLKVTKVVVPWLKCTREPSQFRSEYEEFVDKPSLAAVFRFPRYTPPGFFETMVTRSQKPTYEMTLIHHWSKGVYGRHKEKLLRFYLLCIDHEDGSTCIRIEVRHEEQPSTPTHALWSLMLPYLKDVEQLISRFIGARVERYMECPSCHAMSFLGEWQTPKDLQSNPTRQCDSCQKPVDTSFLIQPKEKRTVEDFLMQKLAMKHRAAQAPGHGEKPPSDQKRDLPVVDEQKQEEEAVNDNMSEKEATSKHDKTDR